MLSAFNPSHAFWVDLMEWSIGRSRVDQIEGSVGRSRQAVRYPGAEVLKETH